MDKLQALDVTRILSVGSIGFGFLLAYLSYRLLLRAQDSAHPNPHVMRLIQVFMLFSLALCLPGFWLEYQKMVIVKPERAIPAIDANAPNPEQPAMNKSGALDPQAQFWVSFRVEDSEGKPLRDVKVDVTELAQDGSKTPISSEKSSESGGVNFPVTLRDGRKIKIETSSDGYLGQELVLQKNAITLPARLTRSDRKPHVQ
jgi:hypothetical protein